MIDNTIKTENSLTLQRYIASLEKKYSEITKKAVSLKNEINSAKKRKTMYEKCELIALINREYLMNPHLTRGEAIAFLARKIDPNAIVNNSGDFNTRIIKEIAKTAPKIDIEDKLVNADLFITKKTTEELSSTAEKTPQSEENKELFNISPTQNENFDEENEVDEEKAQTFLV